MRRALHSLTRVSRLGVVAALGIAAESASAQTNVLFIVDASGSMRAKVEGNQTRMSVAKRALSIALKDMPKEARLGMIVYGHRRAKDCKDIELVAPIASEDAGSLAERVEALQPRGETPIAASLDLAVRSFRALKGQNNIIVLVTDGIEECGGDPCAAARALAAEGLNLKAHIVGFTLSAKQRAAIECVVKETGGTYFDAKDPRALRAALQAIKKQVAEPGPPPPPPAPPKPEPFNLLAQKNGTQVVFASNVHWSGTNDDSLNVIGGELTPIAAGQEAVYAFKGGAAARFDGFSIYLPSSSERNPKEIELLAGDEGPTGSFRALGIIRPANGRLGDGWQGFKLPETTAKFFKVKLISGQTGGRVYLYEFRLQGRLVEEAKDAPSPPKSRTNILSRANGTEVTAKNQYWLETVDDKIARIGGGLTSLVLGDEAVFSFRGGAAARMDVFAVYVETESNSNPREIELSVGDEGPQGAFKTLGVIQIANGRLGEGWQEFKLPETTAKYLKVKLVSNFGGTHRVHPYELRLYGELK